MLDVFLEPKILWLLTMSFLITNVTMFRSFKDYKKVEIWIKKKTFPLKIHIKASYIVIFSSITEIHMCSKVKYYVTFKNTRQISLKNQI